MTDTTVTTTNGSSAISDPDSDERRQSLRRAGWFGIAASAAFLATGVLANSGITVESPADAAEMGAYLDDVADVQVGYALYGLAGIALCLLYIPMSHGVTLLLGSSIRARQGTTAVVAGLIALLPAYVSGIVSSSGLVVARNQLDWSDSRLFDLNELASTASTVSFAIGSLLSLGVGPLLWGMAAKEAATTPRWLNRMLIVVGVTGLVWIVPSSNPIVVILILVNVLSSLISYTSLSIVLVRRSRR